MSATIRGDLQTVSTDAEDEQITTTINTLVAEIEDLRDDVEDLQDELAESRRQNAEDRKRISELEDEVERLEAEDGDEDGGEDHQTDGSKPTPDGDTGGCTTPQTPLERTVALPESMATSELTANQERARFVAKDVMNYTRSVPAGRAIKSSEIGTVLRAGTDCKGRSQTVSRVIEFLNELGGDGVEVVERRGERRVVFSDHAARRLQQFGSPDAVDGGGGSNHGVVIGGRT
jgi:outer membrane murein-binding lipoprotein Lpp